MKHSLVASLFALFFMIVSCNESTSPDSNPTWLSNMTIKFQTDPLGNPPQSIWRYKYKNQIVYFVPAQCCDQFSALYDEKGQIICAPDGGITGQGDGICDDFFLLRTDEKLIWLDNRSPDNI